MPTEVRRLGMDSLGTLIGSRVRRATSVLRKLAIVVLPPLAFEFVLAVAVDAGAAAPGDPQRGAQFLRTCVACHSLAPDRNMTGPSLAGVLGRKAGSLASFERYSPALKAANVVWNEQTLDQWLRAPAQFIPRNRMVFAGMPDAKARADLIAFLENPNVAQSQTGPASQSGGTGGPTPQFQDLKKMPREHHVRAITYCRDTYHVATADGETADFWEANLRFKTDSSEHGPKLHEPVILPAGMMGDRATVFFAIPEQISYFIKHKC